MSHPQYLAISKEYFEVIDKNFLKNNWKIEFADKY